MEQVIIEKDNSEELLFYGDIGDIEENEDKEKNIDPVKSEAGKYVTEEEYWEKYYEYSDINYEWNNGILEEKPVSDLENIKNYRWLLSLLECYLAFNPIAEMVMLEFGFRMSIKGKVTIRKPDIGIILNTNAVSIENYDRSYGGIFDICIECLSDSTKKEAERDTIEKKYEYSNAGVQEYYIVDKENGETEFYCLSKRGRYKKIKSETGGIIKSSVLPGFQFRIKDLYSQPSLVEMANDEVYKHFVYTEYQKEKAEKEIIYTEYQREKSEKEIIYTEYQREKAEKEKERDRAEMEKRRADQLEAKLRELGISITL
ncbi:MAG: Uma2 family endonuclease [Desulfobacterales bacterium]|nr:Uma2 family endonuclease [Desulfobacterales bacterium]